MNISFSRLLCDSREKPLGVAASAVRFSWIIASEGTGLKQTEYRIQVTADEKGDRIVWDSGEVPSADSVSVRYGGEPLRSRGRYWWRVRIAAELTDPGDGRSVTERSSWSPFAAFEMAMEAREWRGSFISAEGPGAWFESKGTRFRKAFPISGDVLSVRVYATALGVYEVSMNGQVVGDEVLAPGWTSYGKRLQYQVYDVTDLSKKGENVIAATVGAGWFKGDLAGWLGRRNVYGERTAFLAQVIVTYRDGREDVIATDESWRCNDGPILSSELYHGEVYDARLEEAGWDGPGYDDASWRRPTKVSRDFATLVPADGPPVTRHERFSARLLITPKGERVLDFGRNIAGRVRFTVSGAAGARVALRHAEILDAEGNFYTANLRSAKARILYVLSGRGPETYEPHFTYMGFRYVRVDEWPGELEAEAFEAIAIYSDMERIGRFECSNELVNQLHRNIERGLKGNFVDIPTDCPQRDERLGWTGDAQVFIGTASFLMKTDRFFRKWLRDLSAETGPDGKVPFVVPDVLIPSKTPDGRDVAVAGACGWSDAATICPWSLYVTYADRDLLEENYPTMVAWVEHVRSIARDGLLWDSGFHFGDWVALDAKEGSYYGATPNEFTATAFYAKSTELLAKAARVLGKEADAAKYASLHERIVAAFRSEFFSEGGRIAVRTQTACALALDFGLAPPAHRDRVRDTLVALIEENGRHLVTGFLGTPYLCRALADAGAVEAAYGLLLREEYPSWLYQVKKGATTIWEHWDGVKPDGSMWSPDMNSFNHYAYGSIGQWLHERVAGIAPDESAPGYKRIVFRPIPGGGLTRASASVFTPYGTASIAWRIEGGRLDIDLVVPANATAVLIPPVEEPAVELGSGRWEFTYPLPTKGEDHGA